MTLLAFKTYAENNRKNINNLSSKKITQLLVKQWRQMSEEQKFQWKILHAREKFLQKESEISQAVISTLLSNVDKSTSKLSAVSALMRFLATPPGLRFIYKHQRFYLSLSHKLKEFKDDGIQDAEVWAKDIGIKL